MVCLTAALSGYGGGAEAAGLESALMPGEVISGHAKYESDCNRCHVRFDRAAQRRLCLDCHKEVAADVRERTGHHGRIPEHDCRSCHTDHKGRNAAIVSLDEKAFDHAKTDFALRGKHVSEKCVSCHAAKKKHREAPSDCLSCHRKDDKHKANLGPKCADCHDEADWKKTRFDHARTRFALLRSHVKPKCADCHEDLRFANAPRDCYSCHRKDDTHKTRFGARCETCHDAGKWKVSTFSHERDGRYALRDRHRPVKCEACHLQPIAYSPGATSTNESKTPTTCRGCHVKDDVHKNVLGEKCEACHTETGWKKAGRFDHDRDSRFALRDKHRDAKCDGCHQDAKFRDKTPSTCRACHEKDDRAKGHKGRYGEKCESCHTEKGWKALVFDHDRDTRYLLLAKHRQVKCDSCHKGALYSGKFGDKLEQRCFACHAGDDKHKGQLAEACQTCHTERTWREAAFDHARSRFPLLGRHLRTECKQCHASLAYKDAKTACESCHTKEDKHKGRLGDACGQCHNSRDWKVWYFDHDASPSFKLTGKHVGTSCTECHRKPVQGKLELATNCLSCHKSDDVHLGTFDPRCERCHVTDNWRKIIKRDGVQSADSAARSSR